jgi:hypothetical protein
MTTLRKNLIRLASTMPKGTRERQDLLHLLASEEPRTAALPRATRRPPGPKFRDKMAEWMTADIQSKLEAGGVQQSTIDSIIHSLTGSYGPMLATEYSGGYGSQHYRNFPTQQDAVDWLAGRSELERAPGGAMGMKRYPEILEAVIAKYGAGNDAIRDTAQGLFNKLKLHQKALITAVLGLGGSNSSFQYGAKAMAQEVEDMIGRSSGDVVQQLMPFLEWAAKVPKPPEGGIRY